MLDYEEACRRIERMIAEGEPGYICHVAVNALLNARREPQVSEALGSATLTVPDGMPIVWALRSLGEPIEIIALGGRQECVPAGVERMPE